MRALGLGAVSADWWGILGPPVTNAVQERRLAVWLRQQPEEGVRRPLFLRARGGWPMPLRATGACLGCGRRLVARHNGHGLCAMCVLRRLRSLRRWASIAAARGWPSLEVMRSTIRPIAEGSGEMDEFFSLLEMGHLVLIRPRWRRRAA